MNIVEREKEVALKFILDEGFENEKQKTKGKTIKKLKADTSNESLFGFSEVVKNLIEKRILEVKKLSEVVLEIVE